MPELPEVETVKETLKKHIVGKTIQKVEVYCQRIIRGMSPIDFEKRLIGKQLIAIDRHGKYMFFRFHSDVLVVHLRMEGKFYLKKRMEPREKHEHVIIEFTDESTLRYDDIRKFGTMEIVSDESLAQGVAKLGPEPFDDAFTSEYLQAKVSKSSRPIKSLLLDQTIVAGLGNIYVDEVLFHSRVHPTRTGNSLEPFEIAHIVEGCTLILGHAVALGGTTIRSYVSSLGVTGRFQNELSVHTLAGQPCPVCHTTIVKTRVGGRGTYLCPSCQK